MKIIYRSHNFPITMGRNFLGRSTLRFHPLELLWSVITAGKRNQGDLISHGVFSVYEMGYRVALLASALEFNGNSIVKSSLYKQLDPSEKNFVSYYTALTLAKLFSARLLDTPWLLHLDVYKNQFPPKYHVGSKKHPDLFGLARNGTLSIFETKGRSSNYIPSDLLSKAKLQTQNIIDIAGQVPSIRIAMASFFKKNTLSMEWMDPEGKSPQAFSIETTEAEILKNYYREIHDLVGETSNDKVPYRGYYVRRFTDIGLIVGLNRKIYSNFSNLTIELLSDLNRSNYRTLIFPQSGQALYFVGPDGVLVGITEKFMRNFQINAIK